MRVKIEVTDAMIYAFVGDSEIAGADAHAISVGLAAALAIVEQGYVLRPRCPERLAPGLQCEGVDTEPFIHEHHGVTPRGTGVVW